MRNILVLFLVLFASSCRLTQHYTKYIDENQYGRLHLKKMKLEKSFTKEMSGKIEADAVYFSFYEDKTIDLKGYNYLRFFKSGQFAIFGSKINEVDVNDVQKASVVGYYNVLNNVLLLELPNTSFSKAGKRTIKKFEIEGAILKQIKKSKNETETIYTKIKVKDIKPVLPDW